MLGNRTLRRPDDGNGHVRSDVVGEIQGHDVLSYRLEVVMRV